LIRAAMLVGLLLAGRAAAAPHPDLTIGVASFPSTLHPAIDPEVIKVYVLELADRPVTAFDANGQLVCLLCTEVPSRDWRICPVAAKEWPLLSTSGLVCDGVTARRWGRRISRLPPALAEIRTAASAIPTLGPSSAASTLWTRKPR
jgi:hypothetical protein